jgi:RNA polymerase sigma-70 factor, ECF subfamily
MIIDAAEMEILSRAKSGEEAAFRMIIEKYEQRIAATVTGILGFSPDVEDIGQETFVQFYRSMDRFRGDSGIGTYLTRIAINLSLNELQRRKRMDRFRTAGLAQDAFGDRPPRDKDRAMEIRTAVRQGLQRLEPKFRTVIVLRLVAGYSTKETAAILKLPQGTVLSRLARGQARLKAILENTDRERNGYQGEEKCIGEF